jgi:hypothetical protein
MYLEDRTVRLQLWCVQPPQPVGSSLDMAHAQLDVLGMWHGGLAMCAPPMTARVFCPSCVGTRLGKNVSAA